LKRTFADLHLRPNLRDIEKTRRMIRKASELGYRLIAIPLPLNLSNERIQQIQSMCMEAQVDFALRLDLKPRTSRELIRSVRKFRRKFEIIAVACESKPVARQAAKDRRVDLLSFPSLDSRRRFFDRAEAELASKALASLEIDMKSLLTVEGPVRIKHISCLRKEAAIAQDFHVPMVISSGASSRFLIRTPRDLAALASVFDLDRTSALEAVSKNPVAIVKRNRHKLSEEFVAPGVRVVRRGKDCQKG
jgi:ribonuclease P/MRP protein subunit RPP1